jgi:hypothetical protein
LVYLNRHLYAYTCARVGVSVYALYCPLSLSASLRACLAMSLNRHSHAHACARVGVSLCASFTCFAYAYACNAYARMHACNVCVCVCSCRCVRMRLFHTLRIRIRMQRIRTYAYVQRMHVCVCVAPTCASFTRFAYAYACNAYARMHACNVCTYARMRMRCSHMRLFHTLRIRLRMQRIRTYAYVHALLPHAPLSHASFAFAF